MSKKFALIIGIIIALALVSGVFVIGFMIGNGYGFSRSQSVGLHVPNKIGTGVVDEVFSIIKDQYVERKSSKKLLDGAVEGMIKSLDDPYTRRLKGDHFKFLEEQTNGRFSGVGIELGSEDGKLIVVAPIKNTPAAKAGVQARDVIIKIDGKNTENMQVSEAVKLIRGEEGTKVVLTFVRDNGDPFDLAIVREEIKVPNVSGKIINENVGYINVHQFSESTGEDVGRELGDLKSRGADGIIVDLRSNPGGLLEEAVILSSNFIESGKPIVKTKPRIGKSEVRLATGGEADTDIPLAVLVDKGSASASEIVAGAIQDYKRGKIVGEKTFGKGSVQSVITLSDDSGLVITTAVYLTPKGRSLSKKGVKPDIVVKRDKKAHSENGADNQLDKAVEILKQEINDAGN